MLTALRQGRVAGVRVTVACARTLDEVPHDVYLLDLTPSGEAEAGGGRFDEVPYLECLEPVLDALGGSLSWLADVARTHSSDRDGVGQARLSVLLAFDTPPSSDGPGPDLAALVRSAMARMAAPLTPPEEAPLARGDAITVATAAVAHAFPHLDPQGLSLTDEEHHATEGRWSVGFAQPGVARFQVQLGFVPGVRTSAHVRSLPVGEVVDSVGT